MLAHDCAPKVLYSRNVGSSIISLPTFDDSEYVNYEEAKLEDREKGEPEYLASSIYQIKCKSK